MSTGDQVGLDTDVQDGKTNGPRPWDKSGWIRRRLREMGYTLLSWPYVIAFLMTWLFVFTVLQKRSDLLAMQAMIGAWTIAFARREWANWLATRK